MQTVKNLLEQAKSDQSHSSVSQAETSFSNQTDASKAFEKYKKNLLNINCWNEAGNLSGYQLFNQDGEVVPTGKIAENLLIRISLEGMGKYDWVKVIEISDNENETILTTQPTFDPAEKGAKTVSHFFTAEARNNFCLQLNNRNINFYIIGLKEKQNVAQTNDFVEALRNWVAANVGSYLNLQKGEWKTFADNFLQL